MSLFGSDDDKKAKKKGFLDDVLGPQGPFSPLDKALDPKNADAMEKVNRYQAGYLDHGLSFQESLGAGNVKDGLGLTLSGISGGSAARSPQDAPKRQRPTAESHTLRPVQSAPTPSPSYSSSSPAFEAGRFALRDSDELADYPPASPPVSREDTGTAFAVNEYRGPLREEVRLLRDALPAIGVYPLPETQVSPVGLGLVCAIEGRDLRLVLSLSTKLKEAHFVCCVGSIRRLREDLNSMQERFPNYEIYADDDDDIFVESPYISIYEFINNGRFLREAKNFVHTIDAVLGSGHDVQNLRSVAPIRNAPSSRVTREESTATSIPRKKTTADELLSLINNRPPADSALAESDPQVDAPDTPMKKVVEKEQEKTPSQAKAPTSDQGASQTSIGRSVTSGPAQLRRDIKEKNVLLSRLGKNWQRRPVSNKIALIVIAVSLVYFLAS